jgi:DNA-binding response OmpR family regulator
MPRDMIWAGLRLRPKEAQVMEAIRRAGEHGITTAQLFDVVYGDDRDGGPLTGKKVIHVIVHQLNLKLQTFEKNIRVEWGHYKLKDTHLKEARDLGLA